MPSQEGGGERVTVRPAADPASEIRATIRVAKLAEAWDCDESQIRRLVDDGEIEAHGLGRALRVFIDSANDYQTRTTKAPKGVRKPAGAQRERRQSPVDKAAHRSAVATLRRQGLVP